MLSKQNRKMIFTIILFFFSLITYIFPKLPITCRDCGSIDNCISGNGLDTGWTACVIISSPEGITCQVAGQLCY
jgi:hypothetical protein